MTDNPDTEGSFGESDALGVADAWMSAEKHPPRRAGSVTGIDMTDEPSEFVFGVADQQRDGSWLVSDLAVEVEE